MRRPPGLVRDAIIDYLRAARKPSTISEIRAAVNAKLGDVPSSSVRSYLNLNAPRLFLRDGRRQYALRTGALIPKKRGTPAES